MAPTYESELTLRDGRILRFAEWGRADGHTVVLCHPSSPVMQPGWDAAEAVGVRIVAPVLPGIGRSSFQPGRTILDWPSDVIALASHVGAERFSVAGVSARTPYALACAVALVDRVSSVGVIAGTVPVDPASELAARVATDPESAFADIERDLHRCERS